jgi:hypothetical protein
VFSELGPIKTNERQFLGFPCSLFVKAEEMRGKVSPYFWNKRNLHASIRVMEIVNGIIDHRLSNVDYRRMERGSFRFPLDFPPSWDQIVPSSSHTARLYLSPTKLSKRLISEIMHGALDTIAEQHQAMEIAEEQI